MQLTLPLVSLALCAASSALASLGSEQRMVQMGASQRRALAARNLALSQLSPNVQAELAKRDPSEYTLHYEHLLERDDDDDDQPGPLEEVLDELVEGEVPNILKRAPAKFDAGGSAHDNAPTWVNGHGPGIGRCANGKAAITFDDGPYDWHAEIAQMFHDSQMKTTYFVNGNNWRCIYDEPQVTAMQKALATGSVMYASHSWSHPNFTQLTMDQIDTQISLLEDALFATIGRVPRLIRPPFGETNLRINQHLKDRWGLEVVQWKQDAGDGLGATVKQEKAQYKSFKKGDDILILQHETHESSIHQVIPYALKQFKQKGIKSVTAAKCLTKQPSPYKVVAKPGSRTDKWTCEGKPAPGAA